MTKKEFKELVSIHNYGKNRDGITAIFFDWKSSDGFKYCVYARKVNATQTELISALYDFIKGKIQDTPWYIQLTVAPSDELRFKVPLMSSGLNCLIDAKKLALYLDTVK